MLRMRIHRYTCNYYVHHVNMDAQTELIRSRGRGCIAVNGVVVNEDEVAVPGLRKQLLKLSVSLCLAKISSDGAIFTRCWPST